jgi:hypothetical protein
MACLHKRRQHRCMCMSAQVTGCGSQTAACDVWTDYGVPKVVSDFGKMWHSSRRTVLRRLDAIVVDEVTAS